MAVEVLGQPHLSWLIAYPLSRLALVSGAGVEGESRREGSCDIRSNQLLPHPAYPIFRQ